MEKKILTATVIKDWARGYWKVQAALPTEVGVRVNVYVLASQNGADRGAMLFESEERAQKLVKKIRETGAITLERWLYCSSPYASDFE